MIDRRQQHRNPDEQHRESALRHGAHERLPGIDADCGEEYCQAVVPQHDVGGQRHDPEQGPGAAQLAEDEGDDQRAARDAERDNPDAGDRNRNEPKQNTEHHAETERDVAELGRRLYGVAEMLADLLLPIGRHQHADPIAKLERQVRRRHDIRVVAPNVQQMRRKTRRQRQLRKRNPDHVRLADKNADVVEGRTVLDDPSGFQFSEPGRRFGYRVLAIRNDHEAVAGGQRQPG